MKVELPFFLLVDTRLDADGFVAILCSWRASDAAAKATACRRCTRKAMDAACASSAWAMDGGRECAIVIFERVIERSDIDLYLRLEVDLSRAETGGLRG